jgi:hypothetical protein
MSRSELMRAMEANQARLMALINDLDDLQSRMPDKGVDSPPEELMLVVAIQAESAEAKRLAELYRARMQRRTWLVVAGYVLGMVAIFASVLWLGR